MDRKKLLISQARTNSTRLPNKVLLKILNKELILHFIDRIVAADAVDHMIIATTLNYEDDIIVRLVENYNKKVTVFRGSEKDVLDRYYKAALDYIKKENNSQIDIIRITSDCPLIDPAIINLHIREYNKRKVDYLSSRINNVHGLMEWMLKYLSTRSCKKHGKTL